VCCTQSQTSAYASPQHVGLGLGLWTGVMQRNEGGSVNRYTNFCMRISENSILLRGWVNRALRDPPYTLTGVRRSCSPST
jgi:hypothetical protein